MCSLLCCLIASTSLVKPPQQYAASCSSQLALGARTAAAVLGVQQRQLTLARNNWASTTMSLARPGAPVLFALNCSCRLLPHFSWEATTSLRGTRVLPITTAGHHTSTPHSQSHHDWPLLAIRSVATVDMDTTRLAARTGAGGTLTNRPAGPRCSLDAE